MTRFEVYRFARLIAYLRQREPDKEINYSILVYHLTDADVERVLDGPPPELAATPKGADCPVSARLQRRSSGQRFADPATTAPIRRGRKFFTEFFAAIAVLALFAVLMLASLRDKRLTADEIGHATSGA